MFLKPFLKSCLERKYEKHGPNITKTTKRNIHCAVNALKATSLLVIATMDRVSCSLVPQTICTEEVCYLYSYQHACQTDPS